MVSKMSTSYLVVYIARKNMRVLELYAIGIKLVLIS